MYSTEAKGQGTKGPIAVLWRCSDNGFQLQFLESSVGGNRVVSVYVDNRNLYCSDNSVYLLIIDKNIVSERIFAYMTEI